MSFRILLLGFLTTFLLLGCAGEQEDSNGPLRPRLKPMGDCLTSFSTRVHQFVEGELSDRQVEEFWGCTKNAVREYRRLTAGEQQPDSYSPEAMGRFFREYLDVDLGEGLLASMMEVKRVFLSGDSSRLTWEEIDRLLEFLDELKSFSLEIRPHVKVIFGDRQEVSPQEVRAAALAMDRGMNRIGRWLEQRQQPYSFEDLRQLLHRIRTDLKGGSAQSVLIEKLERAIPAIKPAKRIFISGDQEQIAGHEWLEVMHMFSQSFAIYLNARYAAEREINSALSGPFLPEAAVHVSGLLRYALDQRSSREIALTEFHALFEQVEKVGFLPSSMSAQALKKALDWLVMRPLGFGKPSFSLNLKHLAMLDSQMQSWKRLFDNPFDGAGFDEVVAASAPILWDDQGRMFFGQALSAFWTIDQRRKLVWNYILMDWLRRAYVGKKSFMVEDEAFLATSELMPIFHSFGLFLKTDATIGKRMVREVDVFTQASNGNLQITVPEAVRYLALVVSAYRSAEIWLELADRHCPNRAAECVRRVAILSGSEVLASMPRLRAKLEGRPPEEFVAYMNKAEETILKEVLRTPFGLSELTQVWMIFQYVETFLGRFDGDGNQLVFLNESLDAYKVYGPTLTKLLSFASLPDDEILAFFTFMMKYGDTPFTMFGGQVLFTNWKWQRNDWQFQADRNILMAILNQLSKF